VQFVLVHGGWQGGWAWDAVSARLRADGHNVFAPTLRGLAEGDTDRADVCLADMAAGLIQEIRDRDLHDFVATGHSGGGPVAQLVADRLGGGPGGRVRRIVFMSAWVLRDGESINDIRPPEMVEASRAQARRSQDNTVPMDNELWASAFMQDATPQQLAEVVPRLVPSPFGWFDQPVHLPRFFELPLPASYIFLRDDRAAPRARYEAMAARLRNPRRVECDGSHQAMQTHPGAVAAALLAATAGT
jgi:pimeloyl-ACP methyl ester carboxylesterase